LNYSTKFDKATSSKFTGALMFIDKQYDLIVNSGSNTTQEIAQQLKQLIER